MGKFAMGGHLRSPWIKGRVDPTELEFGPSVSTSTFLFYLFLFILQATLVSFWGMLSAKLFLAALILILFLLVFSSSGPFRTHLVSRSKPL